MLATEFITKYVKAFGHDTVITSQAENDLADLLEDMESIGFEQGFTDGFDAGLQSCEEFNEG